MKEKANSSRPVECERESQVSIVENLKISKYKLHIYVMLTCLTRYLPKTEKKNHDYRKFFYVSVFFYECKLHIRQKSNFEYRFAFISLNRAS